MKLSGIIPLRKCQYELIPELIVIPNIPFPTFKYMYVYQSVVLLHICILCVYVCVCVCFNLTIAVYRAMPLCGRLVVYSHGLNVLATACVSYFVSVLITCMYAASLWCLSPGVVWFLGISQGLCNEYNYTGTMNALHCQ